MIKPALAVMAALALLSAALAQAQESVSATLDLPFELKVGEQAVIEPEDVAVTFVEMAGDSRCPSDVVCIWEGQASVIVAVEVAGEDMGERTLVIGADPSPSAAFGQYSVRLVGLEPYPQSSVQTDPEDYVAGFVVSKASANSARVFVRAAGESSAIVAGWNLERGKGTLVLLSRGDAGVTMSVARFTPVAVPCTVEDARECIDGQVMQATGMISQGSTIHLEVQGNKLITSSDGAHSLDIKRIRTSSQSGPTIELREGERDGPLLVQEIGADYVSGLNFIEYPVAVSEGTPITLHVGDKATNGCTVTLTLLEIKQDSAVFSKVVDENRPCPICWHKV
ncbi:hypothetical protein [Nitrososphaera sp.]|uniref:hypothetical protein n=1 Tax=Nitrososphaera sp. TaxID=1971748 RepID=UPI001796F8EC|nr:hypothetical protein [Nitrososphaera sp.]NWG36602.1 hypothetical protein [Nitrososphaera sp.]